MGIDNNIHVGPYLLISPKKKKIEKTRKIYVSESGKKYDKEIKFSPDDGSPVHPQDEIYFEEKEAANWDRIYSEIKENPLLETLKKEFTSKGYSMSFLFREIDWYGFNRRKETEPIIWITRAQEINDWMLEENERLQLTPEIIQESLEAFNKKYHDLFEILRNHIEFKVEFGVIAFQS